MPRHKTARGYKLGAGHGDDSQLRDVGLAVRSGVQLIPHLSFFERKRLSARDSTKVYDGLGTDKKPTCGT